MAANTKENWLREDAVHIACDKIRARGERVTTNSVYDELGQRGGFQTIQKYLKTWEAKNSAELGEIKNLPISAEVPESIKDFGNNVIKTFWNEAKGRAEADLDSQREAFRQAEAAMNAKIEDVATFSEQQSETIEVLRKQIAEIQTLLDKEQNSNSQLNELMTVKKDELKELEKERDIAHLEIKNLIEQLKKREDESEAIKASLSAEIRALRDDIDNLNKIHEEALESSKNKAFAEIKQLTEQLGKVGARNDLNEVEMADLKKNLKESIKENKTLDNQGQKLQINLDTALHSVLELKAEIKTALKAEKEANRRADMLEGELNALKIQMGG